MQIRRCDDGPSLRIQQNAAGISPRRGSIFLSLLGPDDARTAWRMGVDGLDIVTHRIERHRIDCEFRRGYLEVAWHRGQMRNLREAHATQTSLGYPHDLQLIERGRLHTVIGSEAYVGGMTDAGSGHLHALNLCIGEARAAAELGARVFEHSPVTKISHGTQPALHTTGGTLRARQVVIAGDAYLDGLVREFDACLLPAGSYLIATEPLPESLARCLLPQNHAVCDQNTLLDYYRLSGDRRLIFGGRCNHTGRKPRDVKGVLLPRLLKVFPDLRGVRIDFEWGGTVSVSLKRIPQFGRLSSNVWYAQGYSGHGIVPSHVAGRLLAEAIAGNAERFDIFARLKPARLPGGRWFATPALAIGMSYYRLRDVLGF
jgi:gamma-glutamylputrescine oxidase